MSAAALYVRVSSRRQVEEGLSLRDQEERCRAFVASRGWSLDERHVYVEAGISGAKANRRALDALMQAAELGEFEAVATPRIDRLGRSARHNLDLFHRFDSVGVILYSPDGRDHTDKFIRTVESAIAERERDLLSERVRAVTPAKRARGSYNGGPRPYGYRFVRDEGLVIEEAEAEVVRRLFREYNAGVALRAIARGLNEEGIKGPLGGSWSQGRVADRLDLDLYAGKVGGGEQGRHEAIVGAKTWERTIALRTASAGRNGTRKAGRRSNTHLLGDGLLKCRCGASMYPRKDTRSGRDTYRCRGRDERTHICSMPPLPRADVDGAVRAYIAGHVLSPGMASGEIAAEAKEAAKEATKQAALAERDASSAERRLKSGRMLLLDEELTREEWREMEDEIKADLASARKRAAEARRVAEAIRNPSAELLDAVESIRSAAADEAKDAGTLAKQRAAIERLFETFEVVAGPLEQTAPVVPAAVAQIVAQQEAAVEEALEDSPAEFVVKARGAGPLRVFLVPIPRPEVAERFGATPLDSLPELSSQSVRIGFPCR